VFTTTKETALAPFNLGHPVYWLPADDCTKVKIAIMTHKAIHTDNPPYVAIRIQRHTPVTDVHQQLHT